MFESLIGSIKQEFSNLPIHDFCVPCFLRGLEEGSVFGSLNLVFLIGLAAVAAPVAAEVAIGMAIVGAAYLAANWTSMNDRQKSETLGGLLGGALVGGAAGGIDAPMNPLWPALQPAGVPGLAITTADVGIAVTPAATTGTAAASVAGSVAMMSGAGGGDEAEYTPEGNNSQRNEELIEELRKNGIKHDPDAIVRIGRDPQGKVVFLEKGDDEAGLQHILNRHADDFERRGIPKEEIPDAVMDAVTKGEHVGIQGRGRPVYEVEIRGKIQRIAVSTGNNGFIVGANPAQ